MSIPQPTLTIPLVREWRIRRPVVYRYLGRKYVDDFFDTGALRLSSFAAFGAHSDEQRLDAQEGCGIVIHRSQEGSAKTIIARLSQGQNAFVLCGSSIFSGELFTAFQADSGFRINDTVAFADVISRYVPGFQAGLEGPCTYRARRVVDHDIGPVELDSLKTAPDANDIDLEKIIGAISMIARDDLFFLKSSFYSQQNEYRLIWLVSANVQDHIDIVCPEARQFCTRFEDLLSETMSPIEIPE